MPTLRHRIQSTRPARPGTMPVLLAPGVVHWSAATPPSPAERDSREHMATATKATKQPSPKQVKILQVKQEHPDLTVREIAALADTGHSHVVQTLQRYGIQQEHVEHYKRHRADILAGLQHRLLASVTDEDVKKAPMGSRILAAAQLYDKERLETNKATALIGHGIALSQPLQDAVDRIVKRLEVDV